MNLFEKARENALLKLKYKNLNGFDLEEIVRKIEEVQDGHTNTQEEPEITKDQG